MEKTLEKNICHLLTKVAEKRKEIEADWQKNGEKYNIFKIVRINDKEVKMCRVLADLLNPKGLHYQGSVYLKLFMDEIAIPLIEKTGKLNLSKVKITPERKTYNDRFIDIVIDDGVIYIPIEVKFGAPEQPNQIADYAIFSREMNKSAGFIPVLFLTPDWYKSVDAEKDDYVQITFEKHIIPWLERCLSLEETDKISPVKEVLKQYIKAIKSFCGITEDEKMEKEIFELVTKNDESVQAALDIKNYNWELDFNKKALDVFEGSIAKLVQEQLPEYVVEFTDKRDVGDWAMIQIEIKGGEYIFDVSYDWKSFSIECCGKRNQHIEDGMVSELYKHIKETKTEKKEKAIEIYGRYPDFESENDTMYFYKLWKLYAKHPEEVVDKIVNIANALEGAKG